MENDDTYRAIFDMVGDGILIADPVTKKILQANSAVCSMLGYAKEELENLTIYDLHPPADLPRVIAAFEKQAASGGAALVRDIPVMRKDGAIFYADIGGSNAVIGGMDRIVGIFRDITERKREEEELARRRKSLEQMVKQRTAELESRNDALLELNTTFKVLLRQREEERAELEAQIATNVRKLVLPFVELLKKEFLNAGQQTCIDIIETHLHHITTPLLKNVGQFNLTPKELKVAALVRSGRSTREIAEILRIATGSIDIHRNNIRRKLGLTNRRANLQSYLETLTVTGSPTSH